MKEGTHDEEDLIIDDDDDPFEDFQPLKRRKIEDKKISANQNTCLTSENKNRSYRLRKSLKKIAAKVKQKTKKGTYKLNFFSEFQSSTLEFCPSCQVPFIALTSGKIEHVTKCVEKDRNNCTACPEGIECTSVIPDHYESFNHNVIAQWREKRQSSLEKCKDSSEICKISSVVDDVLPSNTLPDTSMINIPTTNHNKTEPLIKKICSFSQKDIRSFFIPNFKNKEENVSNTSKASNESKLSNCDSSQPAKSPKKQWSSEWWRTPIKKITEKKQSTENVEWKEFAEENSKTSRYKNSKRKCPFYKIISGSNFAVDAFSYGEIPNIQAYFLSHFHYDHYQGLGRKFCFPIYCSKVTANLVEMQLKVTAKHLNPLPLQEKCLINGVEIVLLEANHCPGAVMFYFRFPNGRTVLHTGDFRAHPDMEQYECLLEARVDVLYLDTTYCDPVYDFPYQHEAVKFAVSLAEDTLSYCKKTLFVCGTYTIGKEKIFLAIAKALKSKVCAMPQKLRILRCLEDPSILPMLTSNWKEAQVHVLPMNKINFKTLKQHLDEFASLYSNIIAIKPTGWEYRKSVALCNIKPKTSGPIKIYGIPYSEHSSYSELKRFVQFLKPHHILPTVNNGTAENRKSMEMMFNSWLKDNK